MPQGGARAPYILADSFDGWGFPPANAVIDTGDSSRHWFRTFILVQVGATLDRLANRVRAFIRSSRNAITSRHSESFREFVKFRILVT